MKSLWMVVILCSVVLTNADNYGGSGHVVHMSVLEDAPNNTRSFGTKVDILLGGQSQLINRTRTVERKLDQLVGLKDTGELTRCPENAGDGVYILNPIYSSIPAFPVYCENGWIVIHRRFNGKLDFNKWMYEYQKFFGDLDGEHWLGLENVHQITRVGSYELFVVLKSFDDVVRTAKYKGFRIGSAFEQYQLHLTDFVEGDAGNSFMQHNTMKFCTPEQSNDKNIDYPVVPCKQTHASGWWFSPDGSYSTNLNGRYIKTSTDSMSWYLFNHSNECLKEARMMIRAVN